MYTEAVSAGRKQRSLPKAATGGLLVLALWLSWGPRQARASAADGSAQTPAQGEAIDAARMTADMHAYFTGERQGGIWLMGAGAPALGLGAGLLVQQNSFGRGMAYPLLAFGAIDLIGGLTFYLNSLRRVPRFDREIAGQPSSYRAAELPRMNQVNRQMRLLEAAEISLILAGATLTGVGAVQQQNLLAGIGTGLMLETAVLLLYDQLAARRALRYTETLTRFGVSVAAGPGATSHGVLLTALRPF